MSELFAEDPFGERILSLPAETQGERLHVISLMFRPARTPQRVRWWCGRFDMDLFKLWAWVSRTPAAVRCVRKMRSTSLSFKVGEVEARLMSLSQRVQLEMGGSSELLSC